MEVVKLYRAVLYSPFLFIATDILLHADLHS